MAEATAPILDSTIAAESQCDRMSALRKLTPHPASVGQLTETLISAPNRILRHRAWPQAMPGSSP
jgi:hypothetical protein